MSFRNVTYGLTNEREQGFSAVHDEPHMGSLQTNRQTEMWANNKVPYFCSYAPNGVVIYPAEGGTPWKRREYGVTPPVFEGTRFRFTKGELTERTQQINTLRESQQLARSKK